MAKCTFMMMSSNGNIFHITHRSPLNSPHKGQWRGALMFFFICAWINCWVNNREAGDLRCHQAHYDVNVMAIITSICFSQIIFISSFCHYHHWINLLRPGEVCMHMWDRSSMFVGMVFFLLITKPLPEPMLTYWSLHLLKHLSVGRSGSKVINVSGNGVFSVHHQAITWTNVDLLVIASA